MTETSEKIAKKIGWWQRLLIEPQLTVVKSFSAIHISDDTGSYFRRYLGEQYEIGIRLSKYHEAILPTMRRRRLNPGDVSQISDVPDDGRYSNWKNGFVAPKWCDLDELCRALELDKDLDLVVPENVEFLWIYRRVVRFIAIKLFSILNTDKPLELPKVLDERDAEFLIEAHNIGIPISDTQKLFDKIPQVTKEFSPGFQFQDFEELIRTDGMAHGVAVLQMIDLLENPTDGFGRKLERATQ